MGLYDDELPVGLEPPEGARQFPPRSEKDQVTTGSEESAAQPARLPPQPRNGPQSITAPGRSIGRKGLAFLDSGPNFTVIPELEPTIPWMGPPMWRYKYFWKPIGKQEHWPKLNRKNRLDYEITYLEARLAQLANVTQITIGVHNSIGGSGKTTTAIYLATIIHDVTDVLTFAASATANLRTTALAEYAGVSADATQGQEQQVRDLVDLSKKNADFRTVGKMVRRSKFGVRVVAEDRPMTLEKSAGFKRPQFIKLAEALHPVSELIIYDCGNDDVEPETIPLEVARRSDVIVLPVNVENPISLKNVAKELSIFASDDSPESVPYSPGEVRSGIQIATHEKAQRAVVVFTNALPKQKPEDFMDYLPEGFQGVVLTVPKNRYIRPLDPSKVKDLNPADPYKIDKYTTYPAFLEAAVAAFEMAARLQSLVLPDPPYTAV